MIYQIAADLILIFHFCFVLFALFGGLLILRWRGVIWLHLPALIWGIIVQVFVLTCPLTPLENRFRELGGETGYSGGFVEYYISLILYHSLSHWLHLLIGLILIMINLMVYYYVFFRHKSLKNGLR